MNDVVLVSRDGSVATVTLNRPQALNALDNEMLAALHEVIPALELDESVRCVILRGGGGHFMAGGDVKFFDAEVRKDPDPKARRLKFEKFVHGLQPVMVALRRMPKPVVASVRGAAAGFGMSLMMGADLAVAADDAVFTLAYCHIGTSPDGASTFMLPRAVGMKRAMEIALLGDRFGAEQALAWGLVNQVVPAAELDEATRKLAARLAHGPTLAYAKTKALLNQSLHSTLEAQLRAEAESFSLCAASEDFAEGVGAFANKRKPEFKGR